MRVQQFLSHHGIERNPFAEEDAQTDLVFKEHCIGTTYHPTWDKIYGDPSEPATAVVFGEKGAGKTALRLQIARHLAEYNREHPDRRVYVIQYDDFNPFLDRFAYRMGGRRRRPERVLPQFQLWDHMDAILTLGVTDLSDRILQVGSGESDASKAINADRLAKLDRHQRRDLLLLAACYDQSTSDSHVNRWRRLKRAIRFGTWRAWAGLLLGMVGTGLTLAAAAMWTRAWGNPNPEVNPGLWQQVVAWVVLGVLIAAWLPWLYRLAMVTWKSWGVARGIRVGNLPFGSLFSVFSQLSGNDLMGQPLPNKERTDDRYSLMNKLQSILETLGFSGVIVLVDRIDEPHLVNGSARLMQMVLWPLLDNKFLKQPGLGVKMMLPVELSQFIEREDRDFYQRARLDKQNLIPSLQWSGEALYDVASDRLRACAADGAQPRLRELLDVGVSDQRMIDALRSLRVPRHLFRFLYRLLVAHCNAHTEQDPVWRISAETFESILAVYQGEQDAAARGVAVG